MTPINREPSFDEEDCSFLLRELELTAFSAVVSAMRAQGVFNKYKEIVLENVKKVFFISDETFKAEIRRAANDENLARIACTLNPSYDPYVEWGILSLDVDDDVLEVPQPKMFGSGTTLTEADELLRFASQHNDRLADQDMAMYELLKCPAKPFVPERLRVLLRDSESLHPQRILPPPILSPPVPSTSTAITIDVDTPLAPPAKRTPGSTTPRGPRRRKTRAEKQKEIEETVHAVVMAGSPVPSTSADVKPEAPETSEVLDLSNVHTPVLPKPSPIKAEQSDPGPSGVLPSFASSKDSDTGVKEILNIIQRQMQEEQRLGIPEQPARRKRKSKATAADPYTECARTRPFLFLPYNKDGTKPPRGNPERLDNRGQRNSNGAGIPMYSPVSTSNAVTAMIVPNCSEVPQSVSTNVVPTATQSSPMASSTSANVNHNFMIVEASGNVAKDLSVPPSGTVYNVIRRPTTCTPPVLTVSQKAVSASITTPNMPNVLKRNRLSSSTEDAPPPPVVNSVRSAPGTTIRRQVVQTSSITVTMAPKKAFDTNITVPPISTANQPSRPIHGIPIPSAPAVQTVQRTSNQSPVTIRPSSSGSGSFTSFVGPYTPSNGAETPNGANGEVVVTRPILKRSVYKTSGAMTSTSGIRLANGVTTQQNRVVTVHKSASPAPIPHSGGSPSTSTFVPRSSPSPSPTSNAVPVVRKFLPVGSPSMAQIQIQHPSGQFIVRRSSVPPSPVVEQAADVDVSSPPAKRLIYCEPSSSLVTNAQDQVQEVYTVAGDPSLPIVASGSSTVEYPAKESHARPVFMRAAAGGEGSYTLREPIANSSKPYADTSSLYPPHNYEVIQRVYKIQPDGAQGMEAQPYVIRAQEPAASEGAPSNQMESQEDERQPVADILQQSMMEIT